MLAEFSFVFGMYSGVQAVINFAFSKKHAHNVANWTYQNKEICNKTFKSHAFTSAAMFAL